MVIQTQLCSIPAVCINKALGVCTGCVGVCTGCVGVGALGGCVTTNNCFASENLIILSNLTF